jgi:hypothetical protein
MKRKIGASPRRKRPRSAAVGRRAVLLVGVSLIISCGTTPVSDRRVTMIQDPAQEPDPPVIVSLHEVRESDLRARWKSNRADLLNLVGEPVGQFRDTGYYFASLLGYLEANEVLELEPPRYADVLMDLVEFHGGGWKLLEPKRETLSALEPDRFSVAQLRRHYVRMARQAGDSVSERGSHDAGERMVDAMVVLRTSLGKVRPGHLLLIHD